MSSTDDSISEFSQVLKEIHGQPHLVNSEEETIVILRQILEKVTARKVAIALLPIQLGRNVKTALSKIDCYAVEDLSHDDARRVIAECDAGITWAEFGVAKQGALVEITYDDATKLVSSLPLTHIALVSSKRILADIVEAMTTVEKFLRSVPPAGKPVVSFISGPSKTGDIEMKLLYGVHGPNEFHVLILTWM
jgi:L-lactate dehydrogenase complex protein LldG